MTRAFLELRVEDPEHPGTILVAKGVTIEHRDPGVFLLHVRQQADLLARRSLEIVSQRTQKVGK